MWRKRSRSSKQEQQQQQQEKQEEQEEKEKEQEEQEEEEATPSFGSTLLSRATLSNRILKRKKDFAHMTIGRRSPLNSSFANVDLI
jgi:hypothetical protein